MEADEKCPITSRAANLAVDSPLASSTEGIPEKGEAASDSTASTLVSKQTESSEGNLPPSTQQSSVSGDLGSCPSLSDKSSSSSSIPYPLDINVVVQQREVTDSSVSLEGGETLPHDAADMDPLLENIMEPRPPGNDAGQLENDAPVIVEDHFQVGGVNFPVEDHLIEVRQGCVGLDCRLKISQIALGLFTAILVMPCTIKGEHGQTYEHIRLAMCALMVASLVAIFVIACYRYFFLKKEQRSA